MTLTIAVIGQGYVGLPLAVASAKAGSIVIGIEVNAPRVDQLNAGKSPVEDISDASISELVKAGKYSATTDFLAVSGSSIIAICVPTPLDEASKPDLKALISATTSVGKNLKAGTLVIIESTVEPGTTRNVVLPILVKDSGLSDADIDLAVSPERIDPSNKKWTISNTPKIVAGLTPKALDRTVEFYSAFVSEVTKCSSLEIAETAKLLENSFRLINISFINEIAQMCDVMGLNVNEVIDAASTKPYGFMPFYPSAGIGGHCIPIDPVYLAHAAKVAGAPASMIDLAQKINDDRPTYFVDKASKLLGGVVGKKILVVGIAYKPNVADMRESAALPLIAGLRKAGADVSWHDHLVGAWSDEVSAALSDSFDLVLVVNKHDGVDLSAVGATPVIYTGYVKGRGA